MKKVVVAGSGGWGTALAMVANDAGNDVSLWSLFPNEIEQIKMRRVNPLLDGIEIDEKITLTSDLDVFTQADICILAVPSFAVRNTAKKIKPYLSPNAVIVNVGKGLEKQSLKRLSVVIKEEFPEFEVVVLSGPSHAEEVARKLPTAVVCASENEEIAVLVQSVMSTSAFRIYTNADVVGVEISGSLKNVIAISAGICDGLGFGDNTKAALMTRGNYELVKLGKAMGGRSETFSGLAGIGDLIVTCTSMHSRNRRAGILIGEGVSVEKTLEEIGTVEGYYATKNIWELANSLDVEMPIVNECYKILYEGAPARQSIKKLMERPNKSEY